MSKIEVNPCTSYETLKGLILRSTSDEKVRISYQWLRKNEILTTEQYHELHDLWDEVCEKYGVWQLRCVSGSVKHDMWTGSYTELVKFCEDEHWEWNYNNGLMWDLEIDFI